MHAALAKRIDELVDLGWEPHTTTETTASLFGRRPFNWWLFVLVVVFFPVFGGVLYLIFWAATSRTTIFLHEENGEIVSAGDMWMVRAQEAQRESYIATQRQIKEKGFLPVMWPHLLSFLLFLAVWVVLIWMLIKWAG
ncbi:MAG: hypothetical protein KDA22_00285 [Phycisphaerales bacterium]|nr:hypothetical protein [Phycisphaerales bacterium]